MAHRDEPERLRGALAAALGQVAQRGTPGALDSLWVSVAGTATGQSSHPVAYRDGILQVEVETAAWDQALRPQIPQLETRLALELPGFRHLEINLRSRS